MFTVHGPFAQTFWRHNLPPFLITASPVHFPPTRVNECFNDFWLQYINSLRNRLIVRWHLSRDQAVACGSGNQIYRLLSPTDWCTVHCDVLLWLLSQEHHYRMKNESCLISITQLELNGCVEASLLRTTPTTWDKKGGSDVTVSVTQCKTTLNTRVKEASALKYPSVSNVFFHRTQFTEDTLTWPPRHRLREFFKSTTEKLNDHCVVHCWDVPSLLMKIERWCTMVNHMCPSTRVFLQINPSVILEILHDQESRVRIDSTWLHFELSRNI